MQDSVIKVLLLPFSLLYGLGISLRNLLYRMSVLRSVRFDLPVISVGNLAVGGTGKSPHIEYLIRWLEQFIMPGVLSRGYGRKSHGFQTVSIIDSARTVGDEPLQFKRKFPNVPISVSESRALGVPEMVRRNPELQCILLDDAFQHLAVTPGMHIMLSEYNHLFTRDWLLPAGRLREWRNAYRRADIIIVTKCPENLTAEKQREIELEIDPYTWQRVYFSKYTYGKPYHLYDPQKTITLTAEVNALLVCAIAGTDYLLEYLGKRVGFVYSFEFTDHHEFVEADLDDIKKRFEALNYPNKIMLTTEKDATRLEPFIAFFEKNNIPVYVLPIEVCFVGNDEHRFQEDIKKFLLDFQV